MSSMERHRQAGRQQAPMQRHAKGTRTGGNTARRQRQGRDEKISDRKGESNDPAHARLAQAWEVGGRSNNASQANPGTMSSTERHRQASRQQAPQRRPANAQAGGESGRKGEKDSKQGKGASPTHARRQEGRRDKENAVSVCVLTEAGPGPQALAPSDPRAECNARISSRGGWVQTVETRP